MHFFFVSIQVKPLGGTKQFYFPLGETEKKELVANCDRFRILKHSFFNPYAFTEQGVATLYAL